MRRINSLLTCFLMMGFILAISPGSLSGSAAKAAAARLPTEVEANTAAITTTYVDNYGYVAAGVSSAWVEMTNSVEITAFSPNADDAYVGPFTIGFYFPLYEYSGYTQLRISTNGYLTLDGIVGEQLVRNLDLPSDQKPNNIIAPFWDDLVKGSGHLFYWNSNLDGQEYFAVRWESFSRFNAVETVTFQALLFKNGDILFQYAGMNGNLSDASVGIEDGAGVDGISYLFNDTGSPISSNTAIRFTRPGPGRRAKLTPLYSGGFIVGGKASFNVTLTNTGNVTLVDPWDSYNLSYSVQEGSISGWQVVYLLNGLPVTNSGALAQLANQEFLVLVLPPVGAVVGDHALIRLKATSTQDTTRSATISVQVAVPAKFMHAYADTPGMHLGLYWKENVASSHFNKFDQNVALAPGGEKYVMVWDIQEGSGANLNYVVINELGMPAPYVSRLENNIYTNDRFPFLASGSETNPQVAVLWQHEIDYVFNLMLAVLNPYLENPIAIPPVQVTNNVVRDIDPGGYQMQDASAFWVGSDALWLIWKEWYPAAGTTDIRVGLFSLSSQTWLGGPHLLAVDDSDIYYADPILIGLEDGTVLAFFSGMNDLEKTQQIYWASLGTTGQILKGKTELGDLQGSSLDAAILEDRVMLAWVTPDRGAVSYSLISLSGIGSTLSLDPGSPQLLVLKNLNLVEHISLFADQQQNGILTWKNVDHTQMYYALVDSSGVLRTPAVMFFRDPSSGIVVSINGQSSTNYVGAYRTALPMISK